MIHEIALAEEHIVEIGLAAFFSDWPHEIASMAIPRFSGHGACCDGHRRSFFLLSISKLATSGLKASVARRAVSRMNGLRWQNATEQWHGHRRGE
jgi:hypothetical protein